jgi:hypothetical protein
VSPICGGFTRGGRWGGCRFGGEVTVMWAKALGRGLSHDSEVLLVSLFEETNVADIGRCLKTLDLKDLGGRVFCKGIMSVVGY